MMSTKIPPTVGRVVLYRCEHNGEEHAATIAKVNEDGTINIGALDSHGVPYNRENVPLVQDGEEAPSECGYAYWMKYQLGQAAKAEALEAELGKHAIAGRLGDPAPNRPTPEMLNVPGAEKSSGADPADQSEPPKAPAAGQVA